MGLTGFNRRRRFDAEAAADAADSAYEPAGDGIAPHPEASEASEVKAKRGRKPRAEQAPPPSGSSSTVVSSVDDAGSAAGELAPDSEG